MAPVRRPVYTERSFTMPHSKFIALVVSGGVLAVSGLACHSSSPASTTTTPTTPTSGPTVMLSPATLSFTGPGSLPVTLTNSGTAALTITGIAASGNFTETDNCVGQSVAVGATCSINVSFVVIAASPGGSTGAVTITDNTAAGTDSLSLSGPGVSNAGATLSPTSLTFGALTIGMKSTALTVTLTNPVNGLTAPLTILRIAINGMSSDDFAIAQNTCPSSLAQGTSCTVGVIFAPTGSGTRTGALNFFDNANGMTGNIQIIPLGGTGQ